MKKLCLLQGKIALILLLCSTFLLPSQAFLWFNEKKSEEIQDISKQILVNDKLTFSSYDFQGQELDLHHFVIASLPDPQYGSLYIGEIQVQNQDVIGISALSGLVFHAKNVIGSTNFEIIPAFSDGSTADSVRITIDILDIPNEAPLAMDMELFTYKNIAITCYFDVIDSENDFLTFQITEPPARGGVTLDETGASSFIYTPYENKTGQDEFKYVTTDSSGNTSNEATVKIRIEKADTPVNYADMDGHSAHKSAISLAEAEIFVGECIGNTYLFHPDEIVSREEFLSLAMAVTELAPLENMTKTGFYDDESIPTWSKGYVSAALLAGVIQGTYDESGKPVFKGESVVTLGEASVILDNLLNINTVSDVSTNHWASQASANLSAVGVNSSTSLPSGLNRAEVAELLDGVLALFKEKENSWLNW